MTKLKGDIAEHAVILQSLKRGYGVLQPVGDRMPYDLVLDVGGNLVRIQVKSAWKDTKGASYVVDARRTKTNRRKMLTDYYAEEDFDFLIAYIEDLEIFYVIPFDLYDSYASSIHLAADDRQSRFPRTWEYREAWHLIEGKTPGISPVTVQEPGARFRYRDPLLPTVHRPIPDRDHWLYELHFGPG